MLRRLIFLTFAPRPLSPLRNFVTLMRDSVKNGGPKKSIQIHASGTYTEIFSARLSFPTHHRHQQDQHRREIGTTVDAGLSLALANAGDEENLMPLGHERAKYAALSEELSVMKKAQALSTARERERESERLAERDKTKQLELRRLEDQATIARLHDELAAFKKAHALSTEREMKRQTERNWCKELQESALTRSEAQVAALKINCTTLSREHETCTETIFHLKMKNQDLHHECSLATESNSALGLQLHQTKEALSKAERMIADSRSQIASDRLVHTSSAETIAALQEKLNETTASLAQAQIIIGKDRKKIQDQIEEIEECKLKVAELENDNGKLRSSQSVLEEIENLKFSRTQDITDLKCNLYALQTQHSACPAIQAELEAVVETLKREHAPCKDRIALLRQQVADLQKLPAGESGKQMMRSLNAELERLRCELAAVVKAHAPCAGDAATMQRQIVELKRVVATMSSEKMEAMHKDEPLLLKKEVTSAQRSAPPPGAASEERKTMDGLQRQIAEKLKLETVVAQLKEALAASECSGRVAAVAADKVASRLESQIEQLKEELTGGSRADAVASANAEETAQLKSYLNEALAEAERTRCQDAADASATLAECMSAKTVLEAEIAECRQALEEVKSKWTTAEREAEESLKAAETRAQVLVAQAHEIEESKATLEKSLVAKMQEQRDLLDRIGRSDEDKKAMEDRLAVVSESERSVKQQLLEHIAAAQGERICANGVLERTKEMLEEAVAEKERMLAQFVNEKRQLKEELKRLSSLEEDVVRLRVETEKMEHTKGEAEAKQKQLIELHLEMKTMKEVAQKALAESQEAEATLQARLDECEGEKRRWEKAESMLLDAGKEKAIAAEERKRLEEEIRQGLSAKEASQTRVKELEARILEYQAGTGTLIEKIREEEASKVALEKNLNQKIQDLLQRIEQADRDKKDMDVKVLALATDKGAVTQQMQHLTEHITAAEEKAVLAYAALHTVKARLEAAVEEEQRLAEELAQAVKESKALEAEVKRLSSKVEDMDAEKEKVKLRGEVIPVVAEESSVAPEKDLARLSEEVEKFKTLLQDAEKERAMVEEERMRLSGENEKLTHKWASLQKDQGQLTETNSLLHKEVDQLHKSHEQDSDLINSLRKQITSMQSICDESVSRQIETERRECAEAIANAEKDLHCRMQAMKDALAASEFIIHKDNQVRSDLEKQLEIEKYKQLEMEQEIMDLSIELASAKNARAQGDEDAIALKKTLNDDKHTQTQLQQEIKRLQNELATAKQSCAQGAEEMETLKMKLSKRKIQGSEENDVLKKKINEENSHTAELKQNLAAMWKENGQFKDTIDALQKEIVTLKNQHAPCTDRIAALNEDVVTLKNQYSSYQDTIAALNQEIIALQSLHAPCDDLIKSLRNLPAVSKPGENTGGHSDSVVEHRHITVRTDKQTEVQNDEKSGKVENGDNGWGYGFGGLKVVGDMGLEGFGGLDVAMKRMSGAIGFTSAPLEDMSESSAGESLRTDTAAKTDTATPKREDELPKLNPKCLVLVNKTKELVGRELFAPHQPVVPSSSTTTTTIGMHLEGKGIVSRVIIGGPAINSGKIVEGDTLVAIDGEAVTGNNAAELLKGNNTIGSVCTVLLRKSASPNAPLTLTLQRMDGNLLTHKRRMWDLLRSLMDRFKKSKDAEGSRIVEGILDLWSKTMMEMHIHEKTCKGRIESMQEECNKLLDELFALVEEHLSHNA